jgi:hypothetical protein
VKAGGTGGVQPQNGVSFGIESRLCAPKNSAKDAIQLQVIRNSPSPMASHRAACTANSGDRPYRVRYSTAKKQKKPARLDASALIERHTPRL